jgi:Uma2 family endonuclease
MASILYAENPAMGLPQRQAELRFTVSHYLAIERKSEERHYYLDGEIYLMAGESPEHGDISANLVAIVVTQLKGGPCRVRTKDTKVRSGPTLTAGDTTRCLFSYPDLVIICQEPQYLDEQRDVVLNPTAVMEVLSPSTEAFDRGEKFSRYQSWNSTLTDYVLISQDQPRIEHYTRQPDGVWTYRRTIGLEATVDIPSIGCTLMLADVYDRVAFPQLQEPTNE